jgi:hypothetical protein
MTPSNFYPSLPTIPFMSVKVEMGAIIDAIKKAPHPLEVKRAGYIIVRNETLNGLKTVNGTNICGAQSDCGKWQQQYDSTIIATCIKNENLTGKTRGFVVFDSLDSGIIFLLDRIQAKGIFIGEKIDGRYHKGDVCTPEQLADAYEDEWVYGEDHKTTVQEVKDFTSMYNQAKKIFA